MRYVLSKQPNGMWQAALALPAGDGTLAAAAQGVTKAEATVAAARVAQKTGLAAKSPNKAAAIAALATAAATPAIRDALKEGGIQAAKLAASFIPGGSTVVKALELAAKYGPAKRLLSKLLPF